MAPQSRIQTVNGSYRKANFGSMSKGRNLRKGGLFKYGMRGESSIIRDIQEWAGKEWVFLFVCLFVCFGTNITCGTRRILVGLEEFSQPEML